MELTFSCFCKFDAKEFVGPKLNEHFASGCGLNSFTKSYYYLLPKCYPNKPIYYNVGHDKWAIQICVWHLKDRKFSPLGIIFNFNFFLVVALKSDEILSNQCCVAIWIFKVPIVPCYWTEWLLSIPSPTSGLTMVHVFLGGTCPTLRST